MNKFSGQQWFSVAHNDETGQYMDQDLVTEISKKEMNQPRPEHGGKSYLELAIDAGFKSFLKNPKPSRMVQHWKAAGSPTKELIDKIGLTVPQGLTDRQAAEWSKETLKAVKDAEGREDLKLEPETRGAFGRKEPEQMELPMYDRMGDEEEEEEPEVPGEEPEEDEGGQEGEGQKEDGEDFPGISDPKVMAMFKQLMDAWHAGGQPMEVTNISKIMQDNGISKEAAMQALEVQGAGGLWDKLKGLFWGRSTPEPGEVPGGYGPDGGAAPTGVPGGGGPGTSGVPGGGGNNYTGDPTVDTILHHIPQVITAEDVAAIVRGEYQIKPEDNNAITPQDLARMKNEWPDVEGKLGEVDRDNADIGDEHSKELIDLLLKLHIAQESKIKEAIESAKKGQITDLKEILLILRVIHGPTAIQTIQNEELKAALSIIADTSTNSTQIEQAMTQILQIIGVTVDTSAPPAPPDPTPANEVVQGEMNFGGSAYRTLLSRLVSKFKKAHEKGIDARQLESGILSQEHFDQMPGIIEHIKGKPTPSRNEKWVLYYWENGEPHPDSLKGTGTPGDEGSSDDMLREPTEEEISQIMDLINSGIRPNTDEQAKTTMGRIKARHEKNGIATLTSGEVEVLKKLKEIGFEPDPRDTGMDSVLGSAGTGAPEAAPTRVTTGKRSKFHTPAFGDSYSWLNNHRGVQVMLENAIIGRSRYLFQNKMLSGKQWFGVQR